MLYVVNKAKSRLFRSVLNLKFFENHVNFGLTGCRPASQPAVRPSCAICRALKITQNNRLLRRIYETVVLKTIFLPKWLLFRQPDALFGIIVPALPVCARASIFTHF